MLAEDRSAVREAEARRLASITAVTAISAAVSAITDKFRAVLDLTDRSRRAVDRELARIYAAAPDMIRAIRPALQDDEVDAVVSLIVEWQVSQTGSKGRRFLDNPRYRRAIVGRAIQTWYRSNRRASARQAEYDDVYREEREDSAALGSPINVLLSRELDERVQKALERMSPIRRAVFNAHVFGQLTHRQIADDLGLELWQVNSHMTSVHNDLREVVRAIEEGRQPRFKKRGRPKGARDSKPRTRGAR